MGSVDHQGGRRRVVLWDVGGTLVQLACSQFEALDRALAAAGLQLEYLSAAALASSSQAFIQRSLIWATPDEEESGYREIAALMLDGCEVPVEPGQFESLARALADYHQRYAVIPGIHEVLHDLARAGVRQGVVSGWQPSLRKFLEYHNLLRYFEVVVGSGEERVLKPDRELFRRALVRMGVSPERAVYVGNDPDLDIVPTEALGMRAILFDPRGRYGGGVATTAELRERLLRELEVY